MQDTRQSKIWPRQKYIRTYWTAKGLIPEEKEMDVRLDRERWFRLRKCIRARLKRNPFHLRKWESIRDSFLIIAGSPRVQVIFCWS